MEGFIHPVSMQGAVERASIGFIIRDFRDEQLVQHEAELKAILDQVMVAYPHSRATFTVKEQYRNMKNILKQYPQVADFAEEAIGRAGLTPKKGSIRGGTDGSRFFLYGLTLSQYLRGGARLPFTAGVGVCTGYGKSGGDLDTFGGDLGRKRSEELISNAVNCGLANTLLLAFAPFMDNFYPTIVIIDPFITYRRKVLN